MPTRSYSEPCWPAAVELSLKRYILSIRLLSNVALRQAQRTIETKFIEAFEFL